MPPEFLNEDSEVVQNEEDIIEEAHKACDRLRLDLEPPKFIALMPDPE